MKSVTKITIGALVVMAAILGYLLTQKTGITLFNTNTNKAATQSATQMPVPDEDKRALLALASGGVSQSADDKRRLFDLANKYAQPSKDITISVCQPTPLVLKANLDQPFTIINVDSNDRQISIDKDHVYTIKAGSNLDMKANFGQGPGEYSYNCDNSSSAVGVIHIIAARQ